MGSSSRRPADHDLLLLCETCESPIDLLDDVDERGVCRHCGLAFDFGPAVVRAIAG